MTANLSDKEIFLQGHEAWNTHVEESNHRFDLSFLEPVAKILIGYRFSNCDFTAARLEGVAFENCEFSDCDFSGANLQGADFRGCLVKNVALEGSIFERCTFSGSSVCGMELRQTAFGGLRFLETSLDDVTLSGGEGKSLEIRNCAVEKLTLLDLALSVTRLLHVRAKLLSVQGCKLDDIFLDNCILTECYFKNSALEFELFECNDLERCEFYSVDWHLSRDSEQNSFFECKFSLMALEGVGLQNSPSLGCAFVDCEWPPQVGAIGILGGYKPAAGLLRQPVQDVYGVDPRLRRDISDAQFLRQMNSELNGLEKFGFRLWGATVGYGLSFRRLCTTTLCFYVTAVFTFFFIHYFETGIFEVPTLIEQASRDALVSMFSLVSEEAGATKTHRSATTVFRILGLLMLGLWINLVSNRLVRLGS